MLHTDCSIALRCVGRSIALCCNSSNNNTRCARSLLELLGWPAMIDRFLDCVASRMLPSAGLIQPVKVLFFNWQRQFCTAHSPASCCILPPASVSLTQPLSPLRPAGLAVTLNCRASVPASVLIVRQLPTPPTSLHTHTRYCRRHTKALAPFSTHSRHSTQPNRSNDSRSSFPLAP